MGEKRKAPKGCYWRGDTLWGRFEVQGVEVRRSLHTDDGKVAEGRLKTLREKETAAVRFGDARTTWPDAVISWAQTIGGHAKPTTVKRYAVSLKQIEPYLIGLYVDEIDKRVVGDIVKRRRAREVSNATIKRDLVALSSVLAHCEDEGWREGNPALDRMRRIKERRDPIVLPDPGHMEQVIALAPGMFADLIRCAWLTGCRQDELRWMERKNLDFGRRQIAVTKAKGSKVRVIDMHAAESVLSRMPVSLHSRWGFWHSGGEPYLNISSNFRRLVAAANQRAVDKAKAAEKLARAKGRGAQKIEPDFRPFTFHHLRHRFAVEWLKSGRGIYELSQHLGHTSVKTTEIYLAYLTAEEKARAMNGSQGASADMEDEGRKS